MKKRHQQKLVFLSLGLIIVFNIPLVFAFNVPTEILGFPGFYFCVFIFWLVSILISFLVLNRYSD